MSRRPSSEGYVEHAIRRIDAGYEVRVGVRTRRARTLSEARAKRHELEQERAESFGQGTSREPLGEYLAQWLEQVHATRSPATYRAWETVVRLRVAPSPIARVRLGDLTPSHLQKWALGLRGTGVSPRTQQKYKECLSAALGDAYKKGLITRQPMRGVELPRVQPHQAVVYSPEQMRRFMLACAQDGSRTSYALRLIAWTGCRSSEACQAVEGNVDLDLGVWQIPTGKTKAAARAVKLRPEAGMMLRELIEDQRRDMAKWEPEHKFGPRWLFRNRLGMNLTGDGVRRGLRRIARKAGLPAIRVHDLRHTFATNALRAGVDRRILGKVLGHANEAMTGLYQHVEDPMTAAVVDAVAQVWGSEVGDVCPTCHRAGWIRPERQEQA